MDKVFVTHIADLIAKEVATVFREDVALQILIREHVMDVISKVDLQALVQATSTPREQYLRNDEERAWHRDYLSLQRWLKIIAEFIREKGENYLIWRDDPNRPTQTAVIDAAASIKALADVVEKGKL